MEDSQNKRWYDRYQGDKNEGGQNRVGIYLWEKHSGVRNLKGEPALTEKDKYNKAKLIIAVDEICLD